jgi:hypothetical protein
LLLIIKLALVAKYGDVFNPAYDEVFMSDIQKIATITDKPLRQLFVSIYLLLKKDPRIAQGTVSAEDIDAREDKKEVMTAALFRKVAEFLGINDPTEGGTTLVLQFALTCSECDVLTSTQGAARD